MANARLFCRWDRARDDATLKRLAAQRLGPNVIAKRMSRGRRTIEKHAAQLGLDLDWTREARPWDAACDGEIERLAGEGFGSYAIAGLTGRSPGAVQKRCSELGIRLRRGGPGGGGYIPPAPEGPLAEAVKFLRQRNYVVHKAAIWTPGLPDDVYQVDYKRMGVDELMALAARKRLAA